MTISEGKVKIVFDVFPKEKSDFEKLCHRLHKNKIDFFREAIKRAEEELNSIKQVKGDV